MNIITAIHNDELFGSAFKDLDTWSSWFVLLKALFGLLLSPDDLDLFYRCTGRKKPPSGEFKELYAIVGRRGGKSFISAVTAVYLALFKDYSEHLSPGERGVVMIIAADRKQAQVIMNYCKGILHNNPVFAEYIERETQERLDLVNDISIEVLSCSYRSVRGRSLAVAIFDEISFWRVDGANPDSEILAAVRPALATMPDSKLLIISSPYARSGILYEHHRDYYGSNDSEILVWQAPTRVMNPLIGQTLIDRECEKDPSAARAEWYAEFREDLESFLSVEAIERCATLPGELAPDPYTVYRAFCDPSGGRHDAFTLAIGHRDRYTRMMTVDLIRGWQPPFDPEAVVGEIVELLGLYRVRQLVGDRYAGAWVDSAYGRHRIEYQSSAKPKSDLYLGFEGFINTGRIEFPNIPQLITELQNLERRRGRSGKDSVDHPPGGSDDYANALAGLCWQLARVETSFFATADLN